MTQIRAPSGVVEVESLIAGFGDHGLGNFYRSESLNVNFSRRVFFASSVDFQKNLSILILNSQLIAKVFNINVLPWGCPNHDPMGCNSLLRLILAQFGNIVYLANSGIAVGLSEGQSELNCIPKVL